MTFCFESMKGNGVRMTKVKDYLSYFFKSTDKLLTFLCLLASSFGVLMVYSATRHTVAETGGFPRDARTMIIAILIGLTIAFLISLVDYDIFCKVWYVWAGLGVLLMILVMLIGVAPSAREDARTWINLGLFYFQPSELVKIFFITTFSVNLYAFKDEINEIKHLLILAVHALIPTALVMISGDDGSALVFIFIALVMVFVAGLNWKYLLGAFAVILAAVPLLWAKLNNFQRQRFIVIWDPDKYPGTAYQQNLGLSALSSGGFLGKGLFKGPYTQSGAVPESWNDMIFTVICEELGLLGGLAALLLLTGIVVRIIRDGRRSVPGPAQYACYGVASMIAIQTFINVAMVLRIGPVIGITLPFFSAGGSSTLCLYVGIGIILSIYRSEFDTRRENKLGLIGVVTPFNESYRDPAGRQKKASDARQYGKKPTYENHSQHEDRSFEARLNSVTRKTDRKMKQVTRRKTGPTGVNYDFDPKNKRPPRSHATLQSETRRPSGTYYQDHTPGTSQEMKSGLSKDLDEFMDHYNKK